ncbi:ALK and LTK ligand 2b-like isoform X1 [Synchiropus splendidus]|uniref:ALK and LTK ligand 2b-like isoform X1 n=1 Tax=Synchiropus splendidus TaxID=270530 RepID=UPI00237EDAED|nr:ALK and LTK ligand 2b-like isoform X1 [Synchiropus splendidus]
MRTMRRHVSVGLFIMMCALTRHSSESAHSAAPERSARREARRTSVALWHIDESRGHGLARTAAPKTSVAVTAVLQQRDLRNIQADRGHLTSTGMFPRDPKKKEKFLKHITGPLYFSPKCRKQVYRLYHHTRDCTIPARKAKRASPNFKRCARLLTRLAGSPQCTEG